MLMEFYLLLRSFRFSQNFLWHHWTETLDSAPLAPMPRQAAPCHATPRRARPRLTQPCQAKSCPATPTHSLSSRLA